MSLSRHISCSFFCAALCSATIALPVSAAPIVQILRGSDQVTTYGSVFADPLTVRVVDAASHRPMAGIRVEFTPGRGVGITPSYALSDANGLASVNAVGLEVGITNVSAQVSGAGKTRVEFSNLQIGKAPLAVVPDNIVSPAGSEIPVVANYSLAGFVNGDSPDTAHITGNPTLTTTATGPGMHANYVIKGNPGTLSAPNYTFVVGYGTLAIVGRASADGWIAGKEAVEAASTPADDSPEVRVALPGQRGTDSQEQPAFIAGLRGDSGVFVRAAIWSDSTSGQLAIRSQNTRTALLVNLATAPEATAVPVRTVALPNMAAIEPIGATMPVHTGAAMVDVQHSLAISTQLTPVRSAMLPGESSAIPTSSTFSNSSIRKAFVQPASK